MTDNRQFNPQPLPQFYHDRIAAVLAYGDIDYTVAASILDAGISPERAREIGLIAPLSEDERP